LTLKSGHSPRALSRVGVQSFAIHRAAATIPQCAYPKTKLLIPPSFKTEWWKGTTAPVAAVSVSFMLWVPRINRSKHFDCVSRIIVNAGFRSCRKMPCHTIKLQKKLMKTCWYSGWKWNRNKKSTILMFPWKNRAYFARLND
jgi:hypothetical protein